MVNNWTSDDRKYDKYLIEEKDVYQEEINAPSILKLIGDIAGKRVLDAGCGNGIFTIKLKELNAEVIGVDASEYLIKSAQKHFHGINFFVHDLNNKLPFEDSSFDVIVSKMVIEILSDIKFAVKEFYRVLKPKGKLIISNLHPAYFLFWHLKRRFGVKNSDRYLYVENYFENVRSEVTIAGGKVKSFPFHRPLQYYLNFLADLGFRIEKIDEPKLTENFVKNHTKYADRIDVPITLNMKLIKD